MALGVDTWAAQLCVELGIPFDAYVPFVGQESKWPNASRDAYVALLHKARHVRMITTGGYSNAAFQRRNKAMVDDCDTLIAVWDGSPGGTANCVRYAEGAAQRRKSGPKPLTIERIDPRMLAA